MLFIALPMLRKPYTQTELGAQSRRRSGLRSAPSGRRDVGGKHVADTSYGLDERGALRVRFDLLRRRATKASMDRSSGAHS